MQKARIGAEGGQARPKAGGRGLLIARIVLAAGGGYALAALAAACFARLLPLPPAQASTTGQMLSFAVFASAIIYAFAVRRVARLAIHLALGLSLLGAVLGFSLLLGGTQ